MKQRTCRNGEKGTSLVEVLVATALFTLFVAALGLSAAGGLDLVRGSGERSEALWRANEGIEAVRAIRATDGFGALAPGVYGTAHIGGKWTLTPTPVEEGGYRTSVDITEVDAGRRLIRSTSVWTDGSGAGHSLSLSAYVHQLTARSWTQTRQEEFETGAFHGIHSNGSGDGAITLLPASGRTSLESFAEENLDGTVSVQALAEENGILYAGLSTGGGTELVAIDMSDASRSGVRRLGSTAVGATVNGIAIAGNLLYLATTGNDREIVVLRRSDLSIASMTDLAGTADALAIAATGTDVIVGRASSASPELYRLSESGGSLTLRQNVSVAGDVAVLALKGNDLAYVSSSNNAEFVLADPITLASVSTTGLPGPANASALTLGAGIAYVGRVASNGTEIASINITDPRAPVLGLDTEVGGTVRGLSLTADGLLAVASDRATTELELLDARTLVPRATFDAAGDRGSSVLAVGPTIILGMMAADPEIIFVRGGTGAWTSPLIADGLDVAGTSNVEALATANGNAYLGKTISGTENEFSVADISTSPPRSLGSVDMGATVHELIVRGTFAYAATTHDTRELAVLDVANPTNPRIIRSIDANRASDGLALAATGTMLFLGTENNTAATGRELYAFDRTDPSNPVLRGTLEIGANVTGIVCSGMYAVLATGANTREIVVVDISNPMSMRIAAVSDLPGSADALSIRQSGDLLLVGTENGATASDFHVIALAPNGFVQYRAGLDLGMDVRALDVTDGIAFAGGTSAGPELSVVDIVTPSTPVRRATLGVGGAIGGLTFADGSLVAGGASDAREISVIRPQGAPSGSEPLGWYVSIPYDSGSDGTLWTGVSWNALGAGTVALQVRTAAREAELPFAAWVGPNALRESRFMEPGTVTRFPGSTGTRFLQYRVELSGDGTISPEVLDVTMTYN